MGAFLRALANSGASNIQEALGLPDITSTEMQDAIDTWFADWFARAPSKELGEDPCQRLPYAIVNKLCKATFAEYDSGLHDTETPKLQWMDGVRTACDKVRRLAMQWAMVGGEAFLKPVILQNGGLSWQVIRRDHWSVLGKLPDGQITDMAIHLKRLEVVKKRMNRILSENTGKAIEVVTADCERDNFMTAQEAVEYGLIDKVIEHR